MLSRSIALIALCAAVTACNSKNADPAANSVDNTGLSTGNAAAANVAVTMAPAPEGLPSRIANDVIAASGQKCDGVTSAERNAQDGTIVAKCSGGESYRVYTAEGKGAVATSL